MLRGASGSGKSDLALRLIDDGAILVSDDYCDVAVVNDRLLARAPANIAGKMEVRGYGIVELPAATEAPVALVVDLMPAADIPRVPDATTCVLEGVTLPWHAVEADAPSAAARVRLALRMAVQIGSMVHR